MKRQQVQLFCGKYTSTSGGLRNPLITDELIESVLSSWRKYDSTIAWQLVDCK
jgi:hypothetical protein